MRLTDGVQSLLRLPKKVESLFVLSRWIRARDMFRQEALSELHADVETARQFLCCPAARRLAHPPGKLDRATWLTLRLLDVESLLHIGELYADRRFDKQDLSTFERRAERAADRLSRAAKWLFYYFVVGDDEGATDTAGTQTPRLDGPKQRQSTTVKVPPGGDRELYERLAIAELMTSGPNATAIANKLGVNRTTMLGWPKFRACYDSARGDAEGRRRERRGRRAGRNDFEGEGGE